MNRLLVETATHDEPIGKLCEEMGQDWTHYWNTTYGQGLAESGMARNVALSIECRFYDQPQFPSDAEAVRTRLGAEGARIQFAPGTIGPFGHEISAITLPSHWSKGLIVPDEAVAAHMMEGELQFLIDSRSFTYSHLGLMRG
jgi:CRISPR-associated endonuclease/helicase Cas3